MAHSLTFNPPKIEALLSQKHVSFSIFTQNSRYKTSKKIQLSSRMSSLVRAISTVNGSVSCITNNLKENQGELADRWLDILGAGYWEGLLDPMDPLLRKELIRYGEMSQACYDAFDYDPYSNNTGNSKYPRSKFFEELGMKEHGYDVTSFIYATPAINLPRFFLKALWPNQEWVENANWIGYVAVSNDETSKRLGRRDITLSWRGTVTQLEWLNDLKDFLGKCSYHTIPSPDPRVKVESGFLSLYTNKNENCKFCKKSAREQVLNEVKRLLEKYPNEPLSITITGHSLGSSLAILNAYDIAETGLNIRTRGRPVPICVFSFAGPRVGNLRFKGRLERLGVRVLRVVNVHDIVPAAPGLFINEHVPEMVMRVARVLPWSYTHVGEELVLDHKNSPFLKRDYNYADAHDLEVYLHLLDGYHGKGKMFKLANGRDHALVNKCCDFLADGYRVPPKWKQDANKGLVRGNDNRWVQPEPPIHHDHDYH